MRTLALAALLLVAPLAGCKHPGSQKLEGRWRGVRAEGVPEAVQVSASSFATGSELIAQKDKLTLNTPGGRPPPVTYKVEREDATSVVVRTERDGRPETFTFNASGDEVVWRIDERRSITFKKVP